MSVCVDDSVTVNTTPLSTPVLVLLVISPHHHFHPPHPHQLLLLVVVLARPGAWWVVVLQGPITTIITRTVHGLSGRAPEHALAVSPVRRRLDICICFLCVQTDFIICFMLTFRPYNLCKLAFCATVIINKLI